MIIDLGGQFQILGGQNNYAKEVPLTAPDSGTLEGQVAVAAAPDTPINILAAPNIPVAIPAAPIIPVGIMLDNPLSILEKEKKEMQEGDGPVCTFPLSDLVMMQMVGDMDQFLDQLVTDNEGNDGSNGGNASNGGNGSNYDSREKSFEQARQLIETTRASATTHKLFPSIVQKTIEAQLGDGNATIRELGQNGMDSYPVQAREKRVVFDFSNEGTHLVLRTRDYGVGMGMKELVRDLLIPYNSGKEFDLTKIGEHGIGWYSIVDLAEVVKVVSRKKDQKKAVRAIVYKDEDIWKTTLQPSSHNGFSPKLNAISLGTEVCAYIPQGKTNVSDLIDSLYQYLGMVDPSEATILLGEIKINSLREKYEIGTPIPLLIDGETRNLLMGVSKRWFKGECYEKRFNHRDQNIHQLLYTQRGLFIKYDAAGFDDKTMHEEIINSLSRMGLDFWVDVPANFTLTKGRNNVIANHVPALLDGMYTAFENLFVDVILNDEELLYSGAPALFQTIAKLFDQNYNGPVLTREKEKYSLSRRMATGAADFGSQVIDLGGLVLTGLGRGLVYTVTKLPAKAWEYGGSWSHDLAQCFSLGLSPQMKAKAKQSAKIFSAAALILGTVGGGSYALYQSYGWTPFIYTGIGVAGIGATVGAVMGKNYLADHWDEIKDKLADGWNLTKDWFKRSSSADDPAAASEHLSTPDSTSSNGKSIGQRLYEKIKNTPQALASALEKILEFGPTCGEAGAALLHKLGLYVNTEEKREKKRGEQRVKVTKKYLSRIHENKFFQRILDKKIIAATYYYSPSEYARERIHQKEKSRTGSWLSDFKSSWLGDFAEMINEDEEHPLSPENRWRILAAGKTKKYELQAMTVRLSIDDLVDQHLQKHLICINRSKFSLNPILTHGDYVVDYNNPLVSSVVDKLDHLSLAIHQQYDVKILEDRLDNVWEFTKGLALFAYYLSGLGIIHTIASLMTEKVPNPIEEYSVYQSVKEGAGFIYDAIRSIEVRKSAGRIGHGFLVSAQWTAGAAAFCAVAAAAGIYGYVIAPAAKALNPLNYPGYAVSLGRNIQENSKELVKCYQDYRKFAEEEKIKREQERISRKELDKNLDQILGENVWKKVKNLLDDWYRHSLIHDFLGYDMLDEKKFEVSKSRLKYVIDTVNAGQGHLDLVEAIERIDQLICQALKTKTYSVQLGYLVGKYETKGMAVDEKRQLHVDLISAREWGLGIMPEYRKSQDKSDLFLRSTYTMFDLLLHQRAHDVIKDYSHKRYYDDLGKTNHHRHRFFGVKDDLRRKVVEYMEQEGVDLLPYVEETLPDKYSQEDRFYYPEPERMAKFVNMTRRRLRDERLLLDHLRITGEDYPVEKKKDEVLLKSLKEI